MRARSPRTIDVLSVRALNRAALARQMLLERASIPALEAVDRLVGLQAQLPSPPYVALWSRLADFEHVELTRLVERRRVVRSTMMRATQHFVTARDFLQFRPVLQPALDRLHRSVYAKRIASHDREEILEAGRTLLAERPHTITELRERLGARWPRRDADAMAYTIQLLLPLAHVPPRGTWGRGGAVPATLGESWLRKPVTTDRGPGRMILRYLAGFGPASVADVQAWSGLTNLRAPMDALRPKLRVFRDEAGRELFDLPDAPRPDADTVAPPRFLPEYDNLLLGYADRSRMLTDAQRKALWTKNGLLSSALVDGRVAATWRIARAGARATLEIGPLARIAKRDRTALAEEGMRLLAFTDPDRSPDVRFARAP
jgi:hypothetical protein